MTGARNALEGIILDVDGTLYRQGPVRLGMALKLIGHCLAHPLAGSRVIRAVGAYRAALEQVRVGTGIARPEGQLELAASRSGLSVEDVDTIVSEWLFRRPLDLVGAYPRPGLHRFVALAAEHGLRLGVFSEYPCEDKLRRLGVRQWFSAVVSSHDPDVRRFKPDPLGFQVAVRRLAVDPASVLVIGDRDDADGAAARAAGLRFLRIGGHDFPSFVALCKYLFPGDKST